MCSSTLLKPNLHGPLGNLYDKRKDKKKKKRADEKAAATAAQSPAQTTPSGGQIAPTALN